MPKLPNETDNGDAAHSREPIDWGGLLRHGSFHLVRWAWLFGLYAVIVSYIFATLGAWQFQDQIREIVGDRSNANQVRQQLVVQLRNASTSQADLVDRLGALQTALGEFGQILTASTAPPALHPVNELKEPPQAGAEPVALVGDGTALGAAGATQAPATSGSAEMVTRIAGLNEQITRLLDDKDSVLENYLEAIKDHFSKNGGEQAAVTVLAEYLTADGLRSPVITPAFYVPGFEGVPRQLATWSEGYLTLLLTLLMGALGSLLYVTRSYLAWAFKGLRVTEAAPQPVSWFIFRPMFGAITALAILILVKAGQLTFSSGTTFSLEEGSVNPYIIAFVAIIAGLMSWQCLELIESVGQRWLQSANRQGLWATGLQAGLDRRNRTTRALADQVGRTRWQIERWLLFKDKVTPEMQDRITTWLDATRTELFGDELPQPQPSRQALLAKDLAAALKESGRTAAVLARQLGVEQEVVQAWIERRAPAPPEAQDAICAWLDQPIAELFDPPIAAATDLPGALALKGQSEQALYQHFGISAEVVGRWLEGAQPVPPEWRPRIAEWLGMKDSEIAWV